MLASIRFAIWQVWKNSFYPKGNRFMKTKKPPLGGFFGSGAA